MSRKFKKSNLNWISELPENWNVQPLKTVLNERNVMNKNGKEKHILSLTINQGVIPYSEKKSGGNKAKEDITKYKLAYKKDLIVNSMNVVVGAAGISKYDGLVSPVYYVFSSKNGISDIDYYYRLFLTVTFQNHLFGLGNGILVKIDEETGKMNTIRKKIPINKLKQLLVPVPPISEQFKISSFLDEKCGIIDEQIKNNQKSIEFLEEYMDSLILKSVNNGIRRNKLKKICIDNITEIPNKWKIVRLKNCLNIYNGKDCDKTFSSDFIPVYGSGGIFGYTDKYIYDGLSLLLGRKGTIDKPLLVKGKFWTVDTMFYTVPKNNCNIKYVYYFMKVLNWDKYIFGTALPSMTQSILMNIKIPLPPIEEQKEIADYLDDRCSKIEEVIEYRKQIIEKLEEYKKSLIYEAVTGKIEV